MLSKNQKSNLNSAFSEGNEAFVDDLKKAATAQLREKMQPGRWKSFWPRSDYNMARKDQNKQIDGLLEAEPTQLLPEKQKEAVKAQVLGVLADNGQLGGRLEVTEPKYLAQRTFIEEHGIGSKKDARNALEVMGKMENAQQAEMAKDYLKYVKEAAPKNKYPSGYGKALLDRSEGREVLELAAKKTDNLRAFEEREAESSKFPLSTRQHLKAARICASADSPEATEARHKFMENECKRGVLGRAAGVLTGERYDQKNLTILNDIFDEKGRKLEQDPLALKTDGSSKRDRLEAAASLVSKYPHIYDALNEAHDGKMTNRQFIKAVQQIDGVLETDRRLNRGGELNVSKLAELNDKLANQDNKKAFVEALDAGIENKKTLGIKVEVIKEAVTKGTHAANELPSPPNTSVRRHSDASIYQPMSAPHQSQVEQQYPSQREASSVGSYGAAAQAQQYQAAGYAGTPSSMGSGNYTLAPAESRSNIEEQVTNIGGSQYARNSLLGRPERLAEFDGMNDYSKTRVEERFRTDSEFRNDFMNAMNDGKSIREFGEEQSAKQAQAARSSGSEYGQLALSQQAVFDAQGDRRPTRPVPPSPLPAPLATDVESTQLGRGGFPPAVAAAATAAAMSSAGRVPAGGGGVSEAGAGADKNYAALPQAAADAHRSQGHGV